MNIKLKEIIAQFLSSADLSEHQFMRIWNIAYRGAKEFNMDISGKFKSVLLDVKANKTVDLPEDYLSFSKIGVLNEAGEIITLRENPNLNQLHEDHTGRINVSKAGAEVNAFLNYASPTRYPFIWLNFFDNGSWFHLYGIGSGTGSIGEYRVDEDCKTIFLNADWTGSSVVVEYLSDGYDCDCDDYVIDEKAAEAMLSYIRWKNAQDNRKKFSTGDVEYYRKEYYNQKRLAKMRLNPVNIREMQAIFRSSIKLVAKA